MSYFTQKTINAFLEYLKEETPKSVNEYKNFLNNLDTDPNSYLLKNANYLELSPRTQRKQYGMLKKFSDWYNANSEYEDIIRLPKLKIMAPQTDPEYLTHAQALTLLEGVKNNYDIDMYIAIKLLLSSGMRIAEYYNNDLHNINYSSLSGKIIGKGGRNRTIYITKDLIDYLPAHNRPPAYLIRSLLYKFSEVHNYNYKITPHILRHTFATLLVLDGMITPFSLCRMLGHNDIETTLSYYIARDINNERISHSLLFNNIENININDNTQQITDEKYKLLLKKYEALVLKISSYQQEIKKLSLLKNDDKKEELCIETKKE